MRTDQFAQAVVVGLIVTFAAALIGILYGLDWPRPGLAAQAFQESARLELEQPVAAVLLVLRGYDTWLELVVLLTVVLGATALLQGASPRSRTPAEPLLKAFVHLLLPLALLAAAYLGGFSGGAVAASALVLWYLAGAPVFAVVRGLLLRALIALAVLAPLLLTLGGLLRGLPLFSYPEAGIANWTALLEVLVTISVASMLAWLVAAAEPTHRALDTDQDTAGRL